MLFLNIYWNWHWYFTFKNSHVLSLCNFWCYFLNVPPSPFQWQRSYILNKLMTVQLAICAHTLLNLEEFLKVSSQLLLNLAQRHEKLHNAVSNEEHLNNKQELNKYILIWIKCSNLTEESVASSNAILLITDKVTKKFFKIFRCLGIVTPKNENINCILNKY